MAIAKYQISVDAANAFNFNKPFHQGNTCVDIVGDNVYFKLFGNTIAWKKIDGSKKGFSNCGYHTKTTQDRLVALGNDIKIKNGKMVYEYDNSPWKNDDINKLWE